MRGRSQSKDSSLRRVHAGIISGAIFADTDKIDYAAARQCAGLGTMDALVNLCGSRTCKPNSVCGIAPAGRSFLWAAHYCAALATYPEVRTRRAGTYPRRTQDSLPIWSCSVWGLPCPPHYCGGGALLPHLFTLTPRIRRCTRRYVFCGTSRKPGLNPASRTLSGTLLCGVRTFLPSCDERPSGPAANAFIIFDARISYVVGRSSLVVRAQTSPRALFARL